VSAFDSDLHDPRTNADQSETGGNLRVSFASKQGAHLYFIKMEGSRPVKIGRANQPDVRLATLQVASPYRLKLLGVIPDCGPHEYDFHYYLRADRMLGEWFKWSRMVERTIKLALAGGDWQSLIKERHRRTGPDGWWTGSPLYELANGDAPKTHPQVSSQ
jgi:hypothetical protein